MTYLAATTRDKCDLLAVTREYEAYDMLLVALDHSRRAG